MSAIFFFLFFFFLKYLRTGHIYSYPSKIKYQNSGYCQNYTLFFSLETGLSEKDYIQLNFPFSLSSSSTPIKGSVIELSEYQEYERDNRTYIPAMEKDHTNYYFNFKRSLRNNIWYVLTIVASEESLKYQTPGVKEPIQMYTVSSLDEGKIIYDENPVFDVFQLYEEPLKNSNKGQCIVDADYADAKTSPDEEILYYLDITINDYNRVGSYFIFRLNNPNFKFINYCKVIGCIKGKSSPYCESNITLDTETNIPCNLFPDKIEIDYFLPLPAMKVLRIMVYIKNSLKLTSSQTTEENKITFLQTSKTASLIFSLADIDCDFKILPFTISSADIKLFWGLKPTSLLNYEGCPIVLYKLKSSSKIIVWNNIKISFKVSKNTPPTLNLYLKVDLTTYLSDILMGSISTNIPSSKIDQFRCYLSLSQYLICSPFFNFLSNTIYSISFKITLKNTAPSTLIIGGVQLFDVRYNEAYTNQAYPSNIIVSENEEFLDVSSSEGFNGATAITNVDYNQFISYSDSDSLTYAYDRSDNGLGIGDILGSTFKSLSSIKFPSADENTQRLFLFLAVSSTQLCQNTNARCWSGSVVNGDHTMLKIVFNNNILNIPQADFSRGIEVVDSLFADVSSGVNIVKGCKTSQWCSQYDKTSQGAKINIIYNFLSDSSYYNGYQHVTFICQSEVNKKACHKIVGRSKTYGTSSNQEGFSALAFRKTQINSYPSYYVDSYVFDFILCFKYQTHSQSGTPNTPSTKESEWTLSTSGVIPTYVIGSAANRRNMKISWINYYAKKGQQTNSDYYIPMFLRIGGFLNSDKLMYKDQPNLISFFINNGADFTAYKEKFPFESGNDTTNCLSSSGMIKCNLFPQIGSSDSQRDVWPNTQRIEISFDLKTNQNFDFFIPLKPIVTSSSIKSLNSLNMVLQRRESDVIKTLSVIRLIGSNFQTELSFNSMLESNSFFDASTGFWSKQYSGINCFDSFSPQIDNLISLYSNNYYESDFKILSETGQSGSPTCLGQKEGSLKNGWGTAFTISSSIDLFSGIKSFGWDFDGENKGTVANSCFLHSSKVYGKSFYSILCTVDEYGGLSGSSIGGPSQYLQLNNMNWPWWWGKSSLANNEIRYAWSSSNGLLAIYRSDTSKVIEKTNGCTSSELIINKLSRFRKYSMFVSLSIPIVLNETDSFNSFIIRNSMSSNLNIICHRCDFLFEDKNFSCSCGKNILNLDLNIKYLNSSTKALEINKKYFIDIYLSSDDADFKIDNFANIYAPLGYGSDSSFNRLLETCSKVIFVSGAQIEINKIILETPEYIKSKMVRSYLKIGFNTQNNPLYLGTLLNFNLGFLALPSENYVKSILRCKMFEGSYSKKVLFENNTSHRFSTASYQTLFNLTVLIKEDILDNFEFSLICQGFHAPNYLNKNNLTMYLSSVGDGLVIQSSNNVSMDLNSSKTELYPEIASFHSMTKNFSFLGFEADYYFNFKPNSFNLSLDGRIIISFPIFLLKKLSIYGSPNCFIDAFLVDCEFKEDFLIIYPNKVLYHTFDQFYTLKISGVMQPNVNKDLLIQEKIIYFGIDDDRNFSNGLKESYEVEDFFKYSDAYYSYKSLFLSDFNTSNYAINSRSGYKFALEFPKNSIVIGRILYIILDKRFEYSMKQSDKINCTLKNESSFNFAGQTDFISNLLLQINIKTTDQANTLSKQNYILEINDVLNPIYIVNPNLPLNFKFFLIIDDTNPKSIYELVAGGSNITYSTLVDAQNFKVLSWHVYQSPYLNYSLLEDKYAKVYKGLYSTKIAIRSFQTINTTFYYKLTNNIENFEIYPQNSFILQNGKTYNEFYLTAKDDVPPGKYVLKFEKLNDENRNSWVGPIPPLLIIVSAEKCRLNTNLKNYEIPINGRSLPIIIDFNLCFPLMGITITAEITAGYNNGFIFKEDKTLTKVSSKLLLIGTGQQKVQKQIIFYCYNFDFYQNLTLGLSGLISFRVEGVNGNSFYPPDPVSVILADSIIFHTPPIPSIPKYSIYKNSVKVLLRCSQPSIIYYLITLNSIQSDLTYYQIKSKTEDQNVGISEKDPNDPSWTIYGYLIQDNFLKSKVNITNLKSAGSYNFAYFCVNQNFIRSPVYPKLNWVQPDNNGRIIKLTYKFNNTLDEKLIIDFICAIGQATDIQSSQIMTDTRLYCNKNERVLQNSTNLVSIGKIFTLKIYIQPNYETSEDDTIQKFQTRYYNNEKQNNFTKLVFSFCRFSSDQYSYILEHELKIYSVPQKKFPDLLFYQNTSVNSNYLTFYLSLSDDGYIAFGVHNETQVKPNLIELKKGMAGNQKNISELSVLELRKKSEFFQINVTKLRSNVNYSVWYATWNDDPSNYSYKSDVYESFIRTIEETKFAVKNFQEIIIVIFIIGIFY